MAKKRKSAPRAEQSSVATRVAEQILDFVGQVPTSSRRKSRNPDNLVREVANKAAAKAALTAGALALPPGPLGWLTILPELLAVWRIQASMVADIAAIHGKTASLTKEHMLYCLFRHTAAQAVRDLVARVGERVLVKPASLLLMQRIARAIGVKVTQRSVGKGLSRLVPILGALGVGGYAYYDTAQVARTATEVFNTRRLDGPQGD